MAKASTSIPGTRTKFYRDLIRDSPLRSEAAKRILAETVVAGRIALRLLTQRADTGDATSDEMRSIPAVSSNIRRALVDLDLVGGKPKRKKKPL